jgi:hypothetical protein
MSDADRTTGIGTFSKVLAKAIAPSVMARLHSGK